MSFVWIPASAGMTKMRHSEFISESHQVDYQLFCNCQSPFFKNAVIPVWLLIGVKIKTGIHSEHLDKTQLFMVSKTA